MQITHLLLFSSFLYMSLGTTRDNINKIEEFKKYFAEYMNQTSSNTSTAIFPILRNLGKVCPCAYDQLKRIQASFRGQNATEVLLMNRTLKALMDQVPDKPNICKYRFVHARNTQNYEKFFQQFLSQRCARHS